MAQDDFVQVSYTPVFQIERRFKGSINHVPPAIVLVSDLRQFLLLHASKQSSSYLDKGHLTT